MAREANTRNGLDAALFAGNTTTAIVNGPQTAKVAVDYVQLKTMNWAAYLKLHGFSKTAALLAKFGLLFSIFAVICLLGILFAIYYFSH